MSLLEAWRHLGQRWRNRLGRRADRRQDRTHWRQWCLLIGRRTLAPLAAPDPAGLTPLLPPPDRFWADPFLWTRDGVTHVFVEELPRATGVGRISVLTLDAALQPTGPAQPVLDEPRHLSYPFLFEFDGNLYMVPESAASRRVDLYRCEVFPHRWRFEHSLITDLSAADATLFPHAGRWWLLCAARHRGTRMNASLFAFHADHPLSRDWRPHAGNPLRVDRAGARPGGRVLVAADGGLLRPAQDCVRRYGHGLRLHRIEALTPDAFTEQPLWHLTGPGVGPWQGLHHLDWHQGVLVMDAQRLLPLG